MKHQPPLFQIAKPCPKLWEEMDGDGRKRFCEHCQLHVHNVSAMSAREQREFSEKSGDACIVYEANADGTMHVPSRWSRWMRPFRHAVWPVTAMVALFLPFLSSCTTRKMMGAPMPPKSGAEKDALKCSDQRVMLPGTPMKRPSADKER